jgi:hypothetical protein
MNKKEFKKILKEMTDEQRIKLAFGLLIFSTVLTSFERELEKAQKGIYIGIPGDGKEIHFKVEENEKI